MSKTNYSPTFPMYPGDAGTITVSDTVDLAQPSVIYVGGNYSSAGTKYTAHLNRNNLPSLQTNERDGRSLIGNHSDVSSSPNINNAWRFKVIRITYGNSTRVSWIRWESGTVIGLSHITPTS